MSSPTNLEDLWTNSGNSGWGTQDTPFKEPSGMDDEDDSRSSISWPEWDPCQNLPELYPELRDIEESYPYDDDYDQDEDDQEEVMEGPEAPADADIPDEPASPMLRLLTKSLVLIDDNNLTEPPPNYEDYANFNRVVVRAKNPDSKHLAFLVAKNTVVLWHISLKESFKYNGIWPTYGVPWVVISRLGEPGKMTTLRNTFAHEYSARVSGDGNDHKDIAELREGYEEMLETVEVLTAALQAADSSFNRTSESDAEIETAEDETDYVETEFNDSHSAIIKRLTKMRRGSKEFLHLQGLVKEIEKLIIEDKNHSLRLSLEGGRLRCRIKRALA